MTRTLMILGLLSTGLIATPGAAQNRVAEVTALPPTGDTSEIVASYYVNSGSTQAERAMNRLNALCNSKKPSDLQVCEETWKKINAKYAEIQARKATRRQQ